MKQFRFLSMLLSTAMVFFLTSCGSNEEKTNTDTTSTDTSVVATDVAPTTNIVTTPQNMMVAKHRVANFAKWKASYEAHDSLRLANGVHSYVIGRGVEDSNMVMVALKIDDVAKAKAFANDASLKQAMQKGGVIGKPVITFNTITFQDTSSASSAMRSMTTFKVKDWDAWRNSFDSSKQLRLDNGVADRAYGYDVDDNHKVTLVVNIIDSAKANAFWKSDLIKQSRAASGVVGQVERFIYRVVERY
jgi:hypothetical protein